VNRLDYCQALEEILRHNVVWIEAQSCSGESVMVMKSGCKGMEDLFFHSSPVKFLSLLSSERSGYELIREVLSLNDYVLVVEGALPRDQELCKVKDMTCQDLVVRLAQRARAVVAVGSCAVNGGILRESGANSVGVKDVLGKKVYEVLGCPASDKMIVAALYYALSGGPDA